jgi:hypothetical protein
MSVRQDSYPPPGAIVRIPDRVWDRALEVIREYATLGAEQDSIGSEALVYLAGAVSGGELLVTSLYELCHAAQGDRVVVTPGEARWLLRTLRARDEKLIGQVHSHRGRAGHSPGDDLHATSFHEGFLSVVVPRFGAGITTPAQCAVLEFRAGKFGQLTPEDSDRRIKVYGQIARPAADDHRAAREEGGWRAFVKKLKSIARSRR